MNFTTYLQHKKHSTSTVKTYTNYIERFLTWLQSEGIEAEVFTYNDLLAFMQHCTRSGVSKRTLHNTLCVVRHYCTYLMHENKRMDNPAAGLFIRGLVRKLPAGLLSTEEMEELYKQYSIQLNVDLSKKIMLGLLVYQGLRVEELMRMEASDIKLKEGKLKLKGTARTNERILSLHASQMLLLQQYLNKNKWQTGRLFSEGRSLNNRIKHLFDQLKKLNAKVINAKQIRSSVITEWLRKNNLRQVQYMAGHKYVSSTQRYQLNNLDDLTNELAHHHPMH
jgi:site-specific recombinase XerD